MAKYGLVGNNISYSFSKAFFTEKFKRENKNDSYHNFDIDCIEKIKQIVLKDNSIKGLNVTIPYKESVIPLLDRVDKEAQKIGAVNTIKLLSDGTLKGYNTDCYGFYQSLSDFFPLKKKTALILGTGGASKAVEYVLKAEGFNYQLVSRSPSDQKNRLLYSQLNKAMMQHYLLIINCTPLGTHPKVTECPNIPYEYITKDHLLFDLIYNPSKTEFLKRGAVKGASICNGMKMLEHQAIKAWDIWNS